MSDEESNISLPLSSFQVSFLHPSSSLLDRPMTPLIRGQLLHWLFGDNRVAGDNRVPFGTAEAGCRQLSKALWGGSVALVPDATWWLQGGIAGGTTAATS